MVRRGCFVAPLLAMTGPLSSLRAPGPARQAGPEDKLREAISIGAGASVIVRYSYHNNPDLSSVFADARSAAVGCIRNDGISSVAGKPFKGPGSRERAGSTGADAAGFVPGHAGSAKKN